MFICSLLRKVREVSKDLAVFEAGSDLVFDDRPVSQFRKLAKINNPDSDLDELNIISSKLASMV